MVIRERFEQQLEALRAEILQMGDLVEEELKLALRALDKLDVDLANRVYALDEDVNAMRFDLEDKCFALIVTQQPTAGDLRAIVAVMNMVIDLERMGDQAKGIAKMIKRLVNHPAPTLPEQLKSMGEMVIVMLRQGMKAYRQDDVKVAEAVAEQDDDVDRLFAQVFNLVMERMAEAKRTERIEANYEILRIAQELERFGDLATNIAERVIYRVTGELVEVNVDEVDGGN